MVYRLKFNLGDYYPIIWVLDWLQKQICLKHMLNNENVKDLVRSGLDKFFSTF